MLGRRLRLADERLSRSHFITEAVGHEFVRRRREGLLRSLKGPHPQAAV